MKNSRRIIANLRSIEILNAHFDNTFRTLTLPTGLFTCQLLVTVTNYVIVKWFREMKIFTVVSIAIVFTALEILRTSSLVKEMSIELLRYLLRGKNAKRALVRIRRAYLWKVIKAKRPISIAVGAEPIFSINRMTTLTYITTVINNTFQLLILY